MRKTLHIQSDFDSARDSGGGRHKILSRSIYRNDGAIKSIALFLICLCASWPASAARAASFSIDPSHTYLRTSLESPANSIPIDLEVLAILPGDWLRLTRLGGFSYWGSNVPDSSTSMIGVFSGSNVLHSHSEQYRVRDAIDAGMDILTVKTAWFQYPTDISQDFSIDDVIIQVPVGATHLFVAAHDSFYSDNVDPNGDFGVEITFVPCEVAAGSGEDCNGNSTPDECEIAAGVLADCNKNNVPDACDLSSGIDLDADGNGVLDECEIADSDEDGVVDEDDNCPTIANAEQQDADEDETGDACDEDDDGDGVLDEDDNCPLIANADQQNSDGDEFGDVCDSDDDDDGVLDDNDNCPFMANWDQLDTDDDGMGDACDEDDDNDALIDTLEAQLGTDPTNADSDGDGLIDGLELELSGGGDCPDPLNPDSDGDSLKDGEEQMMLGSDPCLADTDGDGIPDNLDPLPTDPGGTAEYLEAQALELADHILALKLDMFLAPNAKASAGWQGALFNRAMQTANEIIAGDYDDAIETLDSLYDRVDGQQPPKDWIQDSDDKDNIAQRTLDIIILLEYL